MYRDVRAYSESELAYARPVAKALIEDSGFRGWFLSGTKFEVGAVDACPLVEAQSKLRSRSMKNPFWFNYWCGKDAKCTCRIGSGIETDMLIILSFPDERTVALHVEMKRPGDNSGKRASRLLSSASRMLGKFDYSTKACAA